MDSKSNGSKKAPVPAGVGCKSYRLRKRVEMAGSGPSRRSGNEEGKGNSRDQPVRRVKSVVLKGSSRDHA